MQPQEETIRTRAHQIWEQEGRPEGRDRDHWATAEHELANGESGEPDMDDDPQGDTTLEGDVMNDAQGDGGINPNRRGRMNK